MKLTSRKEITASNIVLESFNGRGNCIAVGCLRRAIEESDLNTTLKLKLLNRVNKIDDFSEGQFNQVERIVENVFMEAYASFDKFLFRSEIQERTSSF